MELSKIHSSLGGRGINPLKFTEVENYHALEKVGIHGLDHVVEGCYGMDSIQSGVTQPSIVAPVQFLQAWLPGLTMVVTAIQTIDELVGIATVGNWFDQQVVFSVLENTGTPAPYGDLSNIPFASWNVNFIPRTVVSFEQGLRIGKREMERAAAANIDDAAAKRNSAAQQLNITRNAVGFYGYNSGLGATYGFLNDTNLPAYIEVAATGTGSATFWSTKTFLQITADLQASIVQLRTQSAGVVDPFKVPCTLALPTNCVDFLNTVSDFGYSVKKWLQDNYPLIRVTSSPQLESANGGLNVYYLFADKIEDASTDDGRTFIQPVPSKFLVLGVAPGAKGYEEDYANATAGTICKRPFAVVRYYGI